MLAHLMEAGALYAPSKFWTEIARQNTVMLTQCGIENFKRALAQNYFNWPVEAVEDPQMRVLLQTWLSQPSMIPFRIKISGSGELSSLNETTFLRDDVSQRVYAFFVSLLWATAIRQSSPDLHGRLSEPAVGNPVPLYLDDRLISQDLANSLREYGRFGELLTAGDSRPVFAEIGAGYGRLGYVARQASNCRYWIFDIPPALAVAEWYFGKLSGIRVFRWRPFQTWSEVADEIEGADVCLFTIDQLALAPSQSVAVFASVSALHEMTVEQIQAFMAEQGRVATRAIYTKNWTEWTNSADGVAFHSNILAPPEDWHVAFDRTDDVLVSFTEKLFLPRQDHPGGASL